MPTTMAEEARAFLGERIALVGVSRQERAFSRLVLRELLKRGLDVVPVSPSLAEAEGRRAFALVGDVDPPVAAALVMTPAARSAAVVRDCIAAGVRRIWLHRGTGAGSASPEAIELCRASGVRLVSGICPFMVLPAAGWFHRAHGFLRRDLGRPFCEPRPA